MMMIFLCLVLIWKICSFFIPFGRRRIDVRAGWRGITDQHVQNGLHHHYVRFYPLLVRQWSIQRHIDLKTLTNINNVHFFRSSLMFAIHRLRSQRLRALLARRKSHTLTLPRQFFFLLPLLYDACFSSEKERNLPVHLYWTELIDFCIDLCKGWLIDWLIGWLFVRLIGWLIDWFLVDFFLIDQLIDWLVDHFTDWLIDWFWFVWWIAFFNFFLGLFSVCLCSGLCHFLGRWFTVSSFL